MATRLKIFVGLFVIICVFQFIQMAPEIRFRRDAPSDESNIDSKLKRAQEEFDKFLNDENTKKLLEAASSTFTQIGKALEDQFNQIKESMTKPNEQKN